MSNAGLEQGLGGVQWELVGCLGLAWVMVYLIVWKGLHQSGKVSFMTEENIYKLCLRSFGSLRCLLMLCWPFY